MESEKQQEVGAALIANARTIGELLAQNAELRQLNEGLIDLNRQLLEDYRALSRKILQGQKDIDGAITRSGIALPAKYWPMMRQVLAATFQAAVSHSKTQVAADNARQRNAAARLFVVEQWGREKTNGKSKRQFAAAMVEHLRSSGEFRSPKTGRNELHVSQKTIAEVWLKGL